MSKKFLVLVFIFLTEILFWPFFLGSFSNQEGKLLGVSDSNSNSNSNSNFSSPLGGIVPHHLLVEEVIDDFFSVFSKQQPKTIILIAPNHNETGDSKVLTSFNDWTTEYGILKVEQGLVQDLIDSNLASLDSEVLSNEHAVFGLVPFIKKNLPETNFVPLVISNKINIDEINSLSKKLKSIMSQEIIFVVTSDFSHYLKKDDAFKNDQITLAMINQFEYSKIISLGNDFLCAPGGVSLFLSLWQKTIKPNLQVLSYLNSGEIMKNSSMRTTSYYSIIFY